MDRTFSALSRRCFVAGAAATAAVAALGVAPAAHADDPAEVYDLVVVGAGSAGLSAAAKAAQDGAKVVVLEAGAATGGTTKLSGGHWKFIDEWFLAHTPERTPEFDEQLAAYLDYDPAGFGDWAETLTTLQAQITEYLESDAELQFDSVEYWLILHYLATKGEDLDGNPSRVDFDVVAPAYYNQGEIAAWLAEGGVTWGEPQAGNVNAGGPLSVEPDGQGFGLIEGLERMATESGAQIVLNAYVDELVVDAGGRVAGVVARTAEGAMEYAAKNVLLATGGYCSNPEMVASTQNCFLGIDATVPSCEPAACDGHAIELATALGAETANTAFVQFYAFPASSMGTIERIAPVRGIVKMAVNADAERFCDDSFTRFGGRDLSAIKAPCDQPGGRFWWVTDAAAQEKFEKYAEYVADGLFIEGADVAAAGEAGGLNGEAFAATVETYNGYVDAGEDPDFGRTNFETGKVEAAPIVTIPMAMYAQNTMGGLVINPQGQVVRADGSAIEGLYAAGEVTGNLDGCLRRHGDNYAQILYYGWLAGKTAAGLA